MAKKPTEQAQIAGPVENSSKELIIRNDSERLLQSRIAERAVACQFPREISQAMNAMHVMATIDERSAAEMSYAIPRGDGVKPGASIRFAEVVIQTWGNCHVAAGGEFCPTGFEINKTDKTVYAVATYYDRQSGGSIEGFTTRGIRDKYGNLYNEDMIRMTCNAAMAIAQRNAILKGVPKAAWFPAWQSAIQLAGGTKDELPHKRKETIAAFAKMGITPDRLLTALKVTHERDITLTHIATLRGMYAGLKSGESKAEELFPLKIAKHSSGLGPDDLDGEQEAKPKKKKKTLDDIANKEVSNGARQTALKNAYDHGRMGFHKGMESDTVLEQYSKDVELLSEWQRGWEDMNVLSQSPDDSDYSE